MAHRHSREHACRFRPILFIVRLDLDEVRSVLVADMIQAQNFVSAIVNG